MKRYIALLLITLFLTGCTYGIDKKNNQYQKYSYEFIGAFDTMIQFMGYTESAEQFEELTQKGQSRFEELHKLYDIYDTYEGINNLKTINDNAGIKPIEVSQDIIDIILFSKEWYNKTEGTVNIALGPVLSIWHTYRDEAKNNPDVAKLPDIELLKKAALKTDISKVEVDTVNKTIFLTESGMSLDVGAVAKGFATEIVARELFDAGLTSFLISSGGNVRVVGSPKDGVRNKWGIGVEDPNNSSTIPNVDNEPLDTVFITDTSVVTSGDYQRYYEVNGQRIHHLIDPTTLMPAGYHRAVTVVTKDSGLADFMSSTIFLLPYDKGRKLVDSIDGVEALWVMPDGAIHATDNMKSMLKKLGGATSK